MTTGGHTQQRRPRRRMATALAAAVGALEVVAVVFTVLNPLGGSWASRSLENIVFVVPVGVFATVGWLIATRRPGNRVGWLCLTIAVLFMSVPALVGLSTWGLRTHALSREVALWLGALGVLWVPALGLIGTHLPLRLPDGQLPSPRWRHYSRLCTGLIVFATALMAALALVERFPEPALSRAVEWLSPLFFLLPLSFLGALASLVVRHRRAGPDERRQIRWIAFGGGAFVGYYLAELSLLPLADVPEGSTLESAITGLGQILFAGLPAGIGVAVLRHRLYDIDVVINRTLVYGALSATLGLTYAAGVVLLQQLLGPFTSGSDLAIAGSTLAVAALFRPARARIQTDVDRRFFRRRYDAALTLEAFSARLREQVDLDALAAELEAVARETMAPAHVSLWLRAPERRP